VRQSSSYLDDNEAQARCRDLGDVVDRIARITDQIIYAAHDGFAARSTGLLQNSHCVAAPDPLGCPPVVFHCTS